MNIRSHSMRTVSKQIVPIRNNKPITDKYDLEISPLCQEILSSSKIALVDIDQDREDG